MSNASVREIVILGAAGDAAVVAESVKAANIDRLVGLLDDSRLKDCMVHGLPILGTLDDWAALPSHVFFIAALHKVKHMRARVARLAELRIPAERWVSVVDCSARVARDARVGRGVYLGPNVVVQPGAVLGDHVSVRAGANIGHDAQVGEYCYLGPNATLCGTTVMERGSHLGPNSCMVDGQRLGAFAVVGVCSAVTKTLPACGIYFGVPAVRIGTVAP